MKTLLILFVVVVVYGGRCAAAEFAVGVYTEKNRVTIGLNVGDGLSENRTMMKDKIFTCQSIHPNFGSFPATSAARA